MALLEVKLTVVQDILIGDYSRIFSQIALVVQFLRTWKRSCLRILEKWKRTNIGSVWRSLSISLTSTKHGSTIRWYTKDQGTVEIVDLTRQTCRKGERGKGMVTVFWDSQVAIYIVYQENVTELYCAELLIRFGANCSKSCHFGRRKYCHHITLHFAVATAKLLELGYELQPHSPCSPDWLHNISFHFHAWKTHSSEILVEWEGYLQHRVILWEPPENVPFRRLNKLKHHWVKCNKLQWEYVDK